MSLDEALKILERVGVAAIGNYHDHVGIQTALKAVREACFPKPPCPGPAVPDVDVD